MSGRRKSATISDSQKRKRSSRSRTHKQCCARVTDKVTGKTRQCLNDAVSDADCCAAHHDLCLEHCAICFEPANEQPCPTCKGYFHLKCFDAWVDAKGTCPLCRQHVRDVEGDANAGSGDDTDEDDEGGPDQVIYPERDLEDFAPVVGENDVYENSLDGRWDWREPLAVNASRRSVRVALVRANGDEAFPDELGPQSEFESELRALGLEEHLGHGHAYLTPVETLALVRGAQIGRVFRLSKGVNAAPDVLVTRR